MAIIHLSTNSAIQLLVTSSGPSHISPVFCSFLLSILRKIASQTKLLCEWCSWHHIPFNLCKTHVEVVSNIFIFFFFPYNLSLWQVTLSKGEKWDPFHHGSAWRLTNSRKRRWETVFVEKESAVKDGEGCCWSCSWVCCSCDAQLSRRQSDLTLVRRHLSRSGCSVLSFCWRSSTFQSKQECAGCLSVAQCLQMLFRQPAYI